MKSLMVAASVAALSVAAFADVYNVKFTATTLVDATKKVQGVQVAYQKKGSVVVNGVYDNSDGSYYFWTGSGKTMEPIENAILEMANNSNPDGAIGGKTAAANFGFYVGTENADGEFDFDSYLVSAGIGKVAEAGSAIPISMSGSFAGTWEGNPAYGTWSFSKNASATKTGIATYINDQGKKANVTTASWTADTEALADSLNDWREVLADAVETAEDLETLTGTIEALDNTAISGLTTTISDYLEDVVEEQSTLATQATAYTNTLAELVAAYDVAYTNYEAKLAAWAVATNNSALAATSNEVAATAFHAAEELYNDLLSRTNDNYATKYVYFAWYFATNSAVEVASNEIAAAYADYTNMVYLCNLDSNTLLDTTLPAITNDLYVAMTNYWWSYAQVADTNVIQCYNTYLNYTDWLATYTNSDGEPYWAKYAADYGLPATNLAKRLEFEALWATNKSVNVVSAKEAYDTATNTYSDVLATFEEDYRYDYTNMVALLNRLLEAEEDALAEELAEVVSEMYVTYTNVLAETEAELDEDIEALNTKYDWLSNLSSNEVDEAIVEQYSVYTNAQAVFNSAREAKRVAAGNARDADRSLSHANTKCNNALTAIATYTLGHTSDADDISETVAYYASLVDSYTANAEGAQSLLERLADAIQ